MPKLTKIQVRPDFVDEVYKSLLDAISDHIGRRRIAELIRNHFQRVTRLGPKLALIGQLLTPAP